MPFSRWIPVLPCLLLLAAHLFAEEVSENTTAPNYDHLIRILSQNFSLADTQWEAPSAASSTPDILIFFTDQQGTQRIGENTISFAWEDAGHGTYRTPGSLFILSADGDTLLQRHFASQQLCTWTRDKSPLSTRQPAPAPPPTALSPAPEKSPVPEAPSFFRLGGTRWTARSNKQVRLLLFEEDGTVELGTSLYEKGRWQKRGEGNYQFLKQNFRLSPEGTQLFQTNNYSSNKVTWTRDEASPICLNRGGYQPKLLMQYNYQEGSVSYVPQLQQAAQPEPSPVANTRWQNITEPDKTCDFHSNGTFRITSSTTSVQGFWRTLSPNHLEAYTSHATLALTLTPNQLQGDGSSRWRKIADLPHPPPAIPPTPAPLNETIYLGGTRWSFQNGKERGLLEFFNDGTLRYGSSQREQGHWFYEGNTCSLNHFGGPQFRLSDDCLSITQNNGQVWQRDEAPAKRADASGTPPQKTLVYTLTPQTITGRFIEELEPSPAPNRFVGTQWKRAGFSCEFLRNGTCLMTLESTRQTETVIWRSLDEDVVEIYAPDQSTHTFSFADKNRLIQTTPDGTKHQWSRDRSTRGPRNKN